MSSFPPKTSPTSPKTRSIAELSPDVELGDELPAHRVREPPHVLLDPLALEGERELGSTVGQSLCDRPRNRPLVGHAEDECAFALEHWERL